MVLGRIIDEAWMLCSKQGGRCYRPALLAAVEGGVNVCIFYYFCVDICFFFLHPPLFLSLYLIY